MSGKNRESHHHEPAGFTTHSSGPASERAREQGWQTNEEERTQTPLEHQPMDGGTDYDYGARDFGDIPTDTSSAQPPAGKKPLGGSEKKATAGSEKKRKRKAA